MIIYILNASQIYHIGINNASISSIHTNSIMIDVNHTIVSSINEIVDIFGFNSIVIFNIQNNKLINIRLLGSRRG